ncbi:hypothetical protein FDP41_007135 [Naegleria fowleri]|uniref:Uncharacterized protein n=1 Tax=Naegleria fowleri TaxID=5763 RepID=A0A6A5BI67_NAEFO|nr:uncharacterized protein FDP41_007135 [Naegleria fowleri]KAF0973748.1 hypothetical protein FDP41_007135 [Naegleria fowleri]
MQVRNHSHHHHCDNINTTSSITHSSSSHHVSVSTSSSFHSNSSLIISSTIRKNPPIVIFVILSTLLLLVLLSRNDHYHNGISVVNGYSPPSPPPSQLVFDHVLFPKLEILGLPPVNQYYYPTMYSVDTDYYDFCLLKKDTSQMKRAGGAKPLFTPFEFSCVDYLCPIDTRFDFTNSTQRESLSFILNYCLYCNETESQLFREALRDGNCDSMDFVNNMEVSQEFYGSKNNSEVLSYLMDAHCNPDISSSNERRNLGLFNSMFFTSEHFKNSFYNYRHKKNSTITFNTVLEDVILTDLFEYYFSDYLKKNVTEWHVPLNAPFTCWCEYSPQGEQVGFYAFQCYDFYQSYQVPFVYRFAVVFFAVVYGTLFLALSFFILIPRFVERVRSFTKRSDLPLASNGKKVLMFFTHFFDILVQPPVFFWIATIAGFLENLFKFIFNFSSAYGLYSSYFSGIGRALTAVFMVCGYSALVVQWSHAIDLYNRASKDINGKLSIFNKVILIVFYCSVIITLIIAAIVFATISSYGYAWIVLTIAVLVFLVTFVVGFTFYGMKILLTLRKQSNRGVFEYRFTKFILMTTGMFVFGWFVCFFTLLTYIFGADVLSVFYGITRNLFLDSCLCIVISVSSYITFTPDAFRMTYGKWFFEKLSLITLCCKPVRSTSNEADQASNL